MLAILMCCSPFDCGPFLFPLSTRPVLLNIVAESVFLGGDRSTLITDYSHVKTVRGITSQGGLQPIRQFADPGRQGVLHDARGFVFVARSIHTYTDRCQGRL